jgi:dihydrofolate synthase/folylpolyglutamate synthase
VNGQLISETEVSELVPEIRRAVEKIQARGVAGPFITYEIGTALALLYFYRQHVQHAVVEVGLGGRLDATNVTHPLVSVITSISYDHMSILGNTLAQIATEKAGIIKQDGIVVTSAQSPEALIAIAKIAHQRNAHMIRIGAADHDPAQSEVDAGQLPPLQYRYQVLSQSETEQHFTVSTPSGEYRDIVTPLLGVHQIENATVALATLEILREKDIQWDEAALRRGFAAVHWPARMQIVGHDPIMVIDGAHNTDSMQKLLTSLQTIFAPQRLIVVLGMNKDKDLAHMVQTLADVHMVIVTRADNPRASSVAELQQLFAENAPNVSVRTAETSNDAMALASELAEPHDLICATGSLYLAGEALRWAAAHGDKQAAVEIEGVDH